MFRDTVKDFTLRSKQCCEVKRSCGEEEHNHKAHVWKIVTQGDAKYVPWTSHQPMKNIVVKKRLSDREITATVALLH